MAFNYIIFAAVLTAVKAEVIGPTATTVAIAQPTAAVVGAQNYNANPQYSYSYSVADGLTGDNKAQEETRLGNIVRGSYSFVESDGSRRTVSYAADSVRGFNAFVQKDPRIAINAAVPSSMAPVVAAAAPAQYVRSAVVIGPQTHILSRPSVAVSVLKSQAVTTDDSQTLRQSTVANPSVTASNIINTNGGLIGAIPLGIAFQSFYDVRPVIASTSDVVGIH